MEVMKEKENIQEGTGKKYIRAGKKYKENRI